MEMSDVAGVYVGVLLVTLLFSSMYIDANDVKLRTIGRLQHIGAVVLWPVTITVAVIVCALVAIASVPLLALRLFRKLRAELLSEIEESTK